MTVQRSKTDGSIRGQHIDEGRRKWLASLMNLSVRLFSFLLRQIKPCHGQQQRSASPSASPRGGTSRHPPSCRRIKPNKRGRVLSQVSSKGEQQSTDINSVHAVHREQQESLVTQVHPSITNSLLCPAAQNMSGKITMHEMNNQNNKGIKGMPVFYFGVFLCCERNI